MTLATFAADAPLAGVLEAMRSDGAAILTGMLPPLRQSNVESIRGLLGILKEKLVKIAHAIKQ